MKNYIKKIFLILLLIFVLFQNVSIADVGSFESYDSGSSWGGSSSSWGSSSWDDDYSYGGSGGSFVFLGGGDGIWLIIFIVFVVIAIAKNKNGGNRRVHPVRPQYQAKSTKSEEQITNEIKAHDELFNKDEIIAWSKTLFVKLQQSWSKRDWASIRPFETNQLFEQHKSQLQGYIDNNQINVMDRICVNYANLYDYRISGDKEILVIKLNSRMQDYIIDATTKKVLRGDPKIERTNSYLLTFERKFGVQTKPRNGRCKHNKLPKLRCTDTNNISRRMRILRKHSNNRRI